MLVDGDVSSSSVVSEIRCMAETRRDPPELFASSSCDDDADERAVFMVDIMLNRLL